MPELRARPHPPTARRRSRGHREGVRPPAQSGRPPRRRRAEHGLLDSRSSAHGVADPRHPAATDRSPRAPLGSAVAGVRDPPDLPAGARRSRPYAIARSAAYARAAMTVPPSAWTVCGGGLGEAGLADARFTHEHDDPPICRSGGVRPGDGLHGSVAADHRESRLVGGQDRDRRWLNRGRRHSVSDRFVASSGLRQRRHSQLAIERARRRRGTGAGRRRGRRLRRGHPSAERGHARRARSSSTRLARPPARSDEVPGGFRRETQLIEHAWQRSARRPSPASARQSSNSGLSRRPKPAR